MREFFFDPVFDGGGDIVNLRDGKIAVHRAMAGDEDFVFDEADVNVVAIGELMEFRGQRIDKIADAVCETFHFLAADNLRAKRLDVDVHGGFAAEGAQEIVLEFRGEAVRIAKAGMFVNLKMKFDEQAAVNLMRGQFVNGKPPALRDGANGIEKIFAGTGARLHVDDHVGRNDFRDAALNAVAGGMGLFERRGARHVNVDINEVTLTGAAQADAVDAEHAFNSFGSGGDFFL